MAMYKNRNTRTGNGMRGTWGMWGMFYFGECRQIFWGMSSNIPGNVPKHSGEYRKTFRGMSPNIPRNVLIYSGECPQIFWRMSLCRIAFISQFCGNKENTFGTSRNRTRAFAVRTRRHNDYASVNWQVVQSHYFKQLGLEKTNYITVSVLTPVSKIFERLMKKQIDEHIKNKIFLSSWGSN